MARQQVPVLHALSLRPIALSGPTAVTRRGATGDPLAVDAEGCAVHSAVSTRSNKMPAPVGSEDPAPPTRLADRGQVAVLDRPNDSPASRADQSSQHPSDARTPDICAESRRGSFPVADTLPVRPCRGRTDPISGARYGHPRDSGYSSPRSATDRDCFDLMWHRHTGEWHCVSERLSDFNVVISCIASRCQRAVRTNACGWGDPAEPK